MWLFRVFFVGDYATQFFRPLNPINQPHLDNPGGLYAHIGDEELPKVYGDYFISQYKDPVMNQSLFQWISKKLLFCSWFLWTLSICVCLEFPCCYPQAPTNGESDDWLRIVFYCSYLPITTPTPKKHDVTALSKKNIDYIYYTYIYIMYTHYFGEQSIVYGEDT